MAERKVVIRVEVDDKDANTKLDRLKEKLDRLKGNFKIRIVLDDGGALLKLNRILDRLDKLDHKTIRPKLNLDGYDRTEQRIDRINAKLDILSHKRVTPKISIDGGGGGFGGGGGGGGGGGLPGGASPYLWGGGIALALSLLPSLVPYVLGLGVGGAGAYGAYKLNKKPFDQTLDQAKNAYLNSISSRGSGIFPGQPALLPGVGEQGMGGPQGSFLGNILGILSGIDKFIKVIGPSLRDLFMASLPVLRSFVKIMEQFALAALPAITQSLQELKSSGALKILTQGFIILAKGIAGFITALGPGMKDSAIIFKTMMVIIAASLRLVGNTANWLAHLFVNTAEGAKIFAHDTAHYFDEFRHETANIFDGVRHEVAHIWDSFFNDTLGTTIRNLDRIVQDFSNWNHNVANWFDRTRHAAASIWDQFWSQMGRMTSDGTHNVLNFFEKLPGQIGHALASLGKALYNIGKQALSDFLSGLKSVATSIWGWFKSFFGGIPHFIMNFLHMSPPHPGSAFYDLGANFMHHVQAGMQSRAASVAKAARGVAGSSAAAYAHTLANKIGWGAQWGFINDVAMRESGWSMTARNPSSGAYGIAQFINGPSEYYQYGGNPNTIAGQVIAFFNYIKQRYGSPAAAWAHELNFGWYDKGGKLPPGLSLALNTTGHDEIHTAGSGGGDTYYITVNQMQPGFTDAEALNIVKTVKKYKLRHHNRPLGIA